MFSLHHHNGLVRPAYFLLVIAAPYFHLTRALDRNESFPLRRPLNNLREAAIQTVGRDGPRYPDEGFLAVVDKYRATPAYKITPPPGQPPDRPVPADCSGGYAVLTMANQLAMETLMPLLLESLHRIELPPIKPDVRHHLARHALVVAISTPAFQACVRLRRRYRNACLSDGLSGLYEGDNRLPDWKAQAYGMAKLKYIVNVLSSGTAVLWLDADAVLFRNPFPDLLGSTADIAVGTAPVPCGTQPSVPDWDFLEGTAADGHHNHNSTAEGGGAAAAAAGLHQQQQQPGQQQQQQQQQRLQQRREVLGAEGAAATAAADAVLGYAPGITFYRSNPGVMRCTYSLLLDMLNAVLHDDNATVIEQEHFATFMPACAEALGLDLAELPARQYLTACGADVGPAVRSSGAEVVGVHASGEFGSSLKERLPLMQGLLGVTSVELVRAAVDAEGTSGEAGTGGDEEGEEE